MNWIKEQVYYHGFRIGIVLILLPIAHDIVMQDLREGRIAIGTLGVCIQIVGIVLMLMGGRDSK